MLQASADGGGSGAVRTERRGAAAHLLSGVQVVSPAPRDLWQRVFAADPTAFPTQKPEWMDALREARGCVDVSRAYHLPDGRVLVLPLASRGALGVPLAEESWPYGWGYGGLLAEGGPATTSDVRLVLTDLARSPAPRVCVVPVPTSAHLWAQAAPRAARRVPFLTQVIDLDGGYDVVRMTKLKKSTRNLVSRSERLGTEVRRDLGGPALTVFEDLYARACLRWAAQKGQPAALARGLTRYRDRAGQVRSVSRALGGSCVLWSAYRAGEPVAVLVVLQHGEHAMSWLTAIDRGLADETGATYLLQARALEEACRSGARHFHMGETDAGTGVQAYKDKWGASPLPYDALRLERLPLTPLEERARHLATRALARRRTPARAS